MAVNPTGISVASSVIDGLAVVLTLFRLSFRLRIQRFWWEDFWAAVVAVWGTVFLISQLCYAIASYEIAYTTSWLTSTSFTSTVWAVRMSLLYSTIRIISPSSPFRKVTRAIAVVFFVICVTLIAWKTWWCVTHTKPSARLGTERPMCILPRETEILELTTDFVSDATLVILPLKLLWKVRLPRRQRRMILCLFSSSALTFVFSLLRAICQLVGASQIEFVAFELELALALVVCDLLVLVTYVYRVVLTPTSSDGSLSAERGSWTDGDDDDFTTRLPLSLTTVDVSAMVVRSDDSLPSGSLSSSER